MRFGISSYSLIRALRAGDMDLAAAMAWIAEQGGEHIELVPMDPITIADEAQARTVAATAADHGLAISSYTIGADLRRGPEEIDRLKREVDLAHALGVDRMRHDAAWRPAAEATDAAFEEDLPLLIEGCRSVAEHAAGAGITTSIENHGFHVQSSARVRRVVEGVDRDNFRLTMDIGNFLCADEDPRDAVPACLPLISMLHVKDFYIRDPGPVFEQGWIKTPGDRRLRGAIIGYGDIDLPAVLGAIAASDYDDFCSVEFEGQEDCLLGAKTGLDNLRALWAAATPAQKATA